MHLSHPGFILVMLSHQSLFTDVSLVTQLLWCVPHRFILSHFLSLQAVIIKVPPLLQVMGLETKQHFPRIHVWSLPVMAQQGLPLPHCQDRPPVSWKSPRCRSVSALALHFSQNKASWLIRNYLLLQEELPAQASLQKSHSIVLLSTCQWYSRVTTGTNGKCLWLC